MASRSMTAEMASGGRVGSINHTGSRLDRRWRGISSRIVASRAGERAGGIRHRRGVDEAITRQESPLSLTDLLGHSRQRASSPQAVDDLPFARFHDEIPSQSASRAATTQSNEGCANRLAGQSEGDTRSRRPPHIREGEKTAQEMRHRPSTSANIRYQPASAPLYYSWSSAKVWNPYEIGDPGIIRTSANDPEWGKWLPRWLPNDHELESSALDLGSSALLA